MLKVEYLPSLHPWGEVIYALIRTGRYISLNRIFKSNDTISGIKYIIHYSSKKVEKRHEKYTYPFYSHTHFYKESQKIFLPRQSLKSDLIFFLLGLSSIVNYFDKKVNLYKTFRRKILFNSIRNCKET